MRPDARSSRNTAENPRIDWVAKGHAESIYNVEPYWDIAIIPIIEKGGCAGSKTRGIRPPALANKEKKGKDRIVLANRRTNMKRFPTLLTDLASVDRLGSLSRSSFPCFHMGHGHTPTNRFCVFFCNGFFLFCFDFGLSFSEFFFLVLFLVSFSVCLTWLIHHTTETSSASAMFVSSSSGVITHFRTVHPERARHNIGDSTGLAGGDGRTERRGVG